MAPRERCPECGSTNITGRAFDLADGDEAQERYCYECSHMEQRLRSEGGVSWFVEGTPAHRMHAAEGVERTLVDEIRAAPDDDGPRTVYADYLIERGDPLGTFIALQLARYRRRDPNVSAEEQALVDANWERWIGLPSTGFRAANVEFERGLWSACKLRSSRAALDSASWATVRHVDIASTYLLDELLAGPVRRSLRSLVLPDRGALDALARAKLALETVSLAFDTSRDPPSLSALASIPTLHTLRVSCLGEFAPRWIERADATRLPNLVVVVQTIHVDHLAAALAAAGKSRALQALAIELPHLVLHAVRDGERFAITRVALHGAPLGSVRDMAPDDAIANASQQLANLREHLDPGVKLSLPAITPALAELAQRFGHKLVAAPTSFAARPTGA